ncbi:MAG: phage holin family protein, partial [Acidobacteriota bacterium]
MKIFDQLRAINTAFFGVLRAEFDALSEDLTAAGKRVVRGLLMVLIALAVAAVLLAVLVFVSIAVLSLWMPLWGAGLVVA